jgi:hypothetical protein
MLCYKFDLRANVANVYNNLHYRHYLLLCFIQYDILETGLCPQVINILSSSQMIELVPISRNTDQICR